MHRKSEPYCGGEGHGVGGGGAVGGEILASHMWVR